MNVFICTDRKIKCSECQEIVDCAGGCGCLRKGNKTMISMTFGVMPTREQFDSAMVRLNARREFNAPGYKFRNDQRVGTCVLSSDELWDELQKALTQYEQGDDHKPDQDHENWEELARADSAGTWVSCVLETLGFEWV